jgi:hypothetical protein
VYISQFFALFQFVFHLLLQQNENEDNNELGSLLSSIEQGIKENNELGSSLFVVI